MDSVEHQVSRHSFARFGEHLEQRALGCRRVEGGDSKARIVVARSP